MPIGGMSGVMGMLPGGAKTKNQIADASLDDKLLTRRVAIIRSMTPTERRKPDLLKAAAGRASPQARVTSPDRSTGF